jgi:CBS domain-containing protein
MSTNLITVSPFVTLDKVKEIFQMKRIHHLPVIQGKQMVGLITTYDLWNLGQSFDDYPFMMVQDVMTTKLAKLSPKDKIGTAAELFLINRFHALPVVEEGKLKGLVTSFDILKYSFKKEYPKAILFKDILERNSHFATS